MQTAFKLFLIVTIAQLLTSCTARLASRPVTDNVIAEGIVYQLPATEITISAEYQLEGCGASPSISIVNTTYSSTLVPDNRQNATFAIDTTALQSGSKTIPDATFTLENNILTGVNYKAQDKTAEIIGKVAEMSAMASGIHLPAIQAGTNDPKVFNVDSKSQPAESCSESALYALSEKTRLVTEIADERNSLMAIYQEIKAGYLTTDKNAPIHNSHVNALRAAYASAVLRLTEDTLDEKARGELVAIITSLHTHLDSESASYTSNETVWVHAKELAIDASKKRIAQLTIQLNEVKANLVATSVIQWLPLPSTNGTSINALYDVSELYKWFSPEALINLDTQLTNWQRRNLVKLSTDCTSSEAQDIGTDLRTAVYYRVPKRCNIKVAACRDSACNMAASQTTLKNVSLAQFGYTAFLPISNGPFEDSDYALAFDSQSGRLSSFTFKSDKAAFLEAATAIATAQEMLDETDIEKLDVKKLEVEKETNLINAETLRLTAKKDKRDAQEALEKESEQADEAALGGNTDPSST